MGHSRITVLVVGNHGCQRDVKDGEVSTGCGSPTCIDCATLTFVQKLKDTGNNVESAEHVHWPESPQEVRDEISIVGGSVQRTRHGNF